MSTVFINGWLEHTIVTHSDLIIHLYGCEPWTIQKPEHLKNCCFRTLALQKTLESPLDSQETKSVDSIGNQP